jgi:hypothetical protein
MSEENCVIRNFILCGFHKIHMPQKSVNWLLKCTLKYEYYNISLLLIEFVSWDNAVGIATGYGLDDPRGWSSSPGSVRNFLHVVQTGPWPHPASYPMGTGGSLPMGKVAEA